MGGIGFGHLFVVVAPAVLTPPPPPPSAPHSQRTERRLRLEPRLHGPVPGRQRRSTAGLCAAGVLSVPQNGQAHRPGLQGGL
jgi:hypothetical protein